MKFIKVESWFLVKSLPFVLPSFLFLELMLMPSPISDLDSFVLFAVQCVCQESSPFCIPRAGKHWNRKWSEVGWSRSIQWSQWQLLHLLQHLSNFRMKHFFSRAFRKLPQRSLAHTPKFHASYFPSRAPDYLLYMEHRRLPLLNNKLAGLTWSAENLGSALSCGTRPASDFRDFISFHFL